MLFILGTKYTSTYGKYIKSIIGIALNFYLKKQFMSENEFLSFVSNKNHELYPPSELQLYKAKHIIIVLTMK